MNEPKNEMLTGSVTSLMARQSVPTIIAMLVNVLYNMVDRIYIGHIPGTGGLALTGVGVTFPIIMLISAFSAFAGAGGAPLFSIACGKQDISRAQRVLENSVCLLLCFTVLLCALFYSLLEPALLLFGASEATLPYGAAYLRIYLAGTLFVQLYMGLNPFVIAQGRTKLSMFAVVLGAGLNIVLDPLLIFTAKMGVSGAAVATVISQACSAGILLRFLIGEKSAVRLRLLHLHIDGKTMGSILTLGASSFVMQATESLTVIILNRQLQTLGGDLYVGTLTVLQSMMQLLMSPLQGFTHGVQPVIGYNYGACRFDRVRAFYRPMILVAGAFTLVFGGAMILFRHSVAALFTSSEPMIELLCAVTPKFMIGMLLFGFQMAIQSTFLALGQRLYPMVIACSRKLLLLIPLSLILPHWFGVLGVYWAEPVADLLSVTLSCMLFFCNVRKLLTPEALKKI